jgi:predicted nucleic acid-binding Zn finger protein
MNEPSSESSIVNIPEDKASNSSRLSKARAVVDSQGVKLHKFHPSGKTIWTVVGRECDFLVDIDPEDETKLYCACGDFYYRVLSTKVTECYHLLALKIALKEELYVVVNFDDDEYPQFLKALVSDDFRAISSSRAGKAEPLP